MAQMPQGQPFSVPDPLADAWDAAMRLNRKLQAKNDPLAGLAAAQNVAARRQTPAAPQSGAGLGERRRGAGPLLELISGAEGTPGDAGYDVVFGYDRFKPADTPRLREMTLDQVAALQSEMVKRHSGSTAVGKYQFKTDQLNELRGQLGLKGSERFTPELQDELATQRLYRKRGYGDFLAGRTSTDDFQRSLAKEWSLLPEDGRDNSHYPNRATGQPVPAKVKTERHVLPALSAAREAEQALNEQIDGGYLPPR